MRTSRTNGRAAQATAAAANIGIRDAPVSAQQWRGREGASKLNLVSCFGQTTFPARSGTKNGQNRTNLEHTLAAYLGGELGHSTGCLEGFVGLENVEPAGKQLCQGVNR